MDSKQTKDYIKSKYEELLEFQKVGSFPNNSFITDIFKLIYDLCNNGDSSADELYELHSYFIKNTIEDSVNILNKIEEKDFIKNFVKELDKINYIILYFNKLFNYLEKYYIKAKNLKPLNKKSFELFKNGFFLPFKEKLFKNLKIVDENDLDKKEENDNHNIKKIFTLLLCIDMIEPKIEKKNNEIIWKNKNEDLNYQDNKNSTFDIWFYTYFFKFIEPYILKEYKELQNLPISEYISSFFKLKWKPYFLKKYFNEEYYYKIITYFNDIFLKNKIEEIEKYFCDMNKEQLKKFYQENKQYQNCLNLILDSFIISFKKNDIKIFENKGIKIDSIDEKKCIPIEIKNEIEKFYSECFDNNILEYKNKMNIIIQLLLNKSQYSKQLSIYVDFCMRKDFKGKSKEEIINILNQIVQTFVFLTDKLDFKLKIEKSMSNRLIKNSSFSLNAEKKFIEMIKQEVGNYYIVNMATMIQDLDNNNKIKDEYNKYKSKLIPKDIKVEVNLIYSRAWRINQKYFENMELSNLLKFISQDFEHVYISKHFHQKLIWCHGLSKINIEYLCFKKNGNYESRSTLLQYLILLQIEKHGKLSLGKIAININCKIDLVLEDISGLIFNPSFNPQHQKEKGILLGTFDDKKQIFKEDDEVWLNNNFNSAKLRFNTIPLNIKKSRKEIKDEEKLDEIYTKKYQNNIIQATTTRIMKGLNGKQVQHSWLINEISNQIKLFNAQPQQIKDNIEKLIEKNIIKRGEKDKSYYEYIA